MMKILFCFGFSTRDKACKLNKHLLLWKSLCERMWETGVMNTQQVSYRSRDEGGVCYCF